MTFNLYKGSDDYKFYVLMQQCHEISVNNLFFFSAISAPPKIIQSSPPGDVWTIPITQSNLYLEHLIQGRPMPIIQWYKDGEPLSALSSLYEVETTNVHEQYMYNVTTRVTFNGK